MGHNRKSIQKRLNDTKNNVPFVNVCLDSGEYIIINPIIAYVPFFSLRIPYSFFFFFLFFNNKCGNSPRS